MKKMTCVILASLFMMPSVYATDIHRTFTVTADTSESDLNMTAVNQIEFIIQNADTVKQYDLVNKNINAITQLLKKYDGTAKVTNLYRDPKNKRTAVSMEVSVPEQKYSDVGSFLSKYANIVGQPTLTLSKADQDKLYQVAQNKTFELIRTAKDDYCKQLNCHQASITKIHFASNDAIFEPVMMKAMAASAESTPMSTDAFQEQKVTLRTSVEFKIE